MAEQTQEQAAEAKQTNCLGCNKPLKKLRRYYRNGKFYCTRRCWLKTRKPAEGQEEQK